MSSIICCSSVSTSPLIYVSASPSLNPLSRNFNINLSFNLSIPTKFPFSQSHIRLPSASAIHSTATSQEPIETSSSVDRFVETGSIYGVHGFQGEVRVKPSTDFPELRFSEPGTRWLKQQISGTDHIQEIELVEGRGHPGQRWIVRFNSINTAEQAHKLVGSTILVKDENRPDLEDGEFYTHDLIGMKVILKASGEQVGTVTSVFNSGASDLLRVRLKSQIVKSEQDEDDSGPLVWVPFVDAIVPTVDLENREMLITPPKGLLELNIRTDDRSKKERREIEWKERKKFQRRLIAAKKKLCEMEQQHVFDGFRHGAKEQTTLLANQIVSVNSKLLQQAMQNIKTPSTRRNLPQILSSVPKSNTLRLSDINNPIPSKKLSNPQGQLFTSNGKTAVCLVLQDIEEDCSSEHDLVKEFQNDHHQFVKIEDRFSVPLILICPDCSISSLRELFSIHDYFSFDPKKVWFLKEERLPVVSGPLEENDKHKILMMSPWEFLQRPVGSGGVITLLSSNNLLENLNEMGVEYIQVRNIKRTHKNGCTLLSLVNSCKADIGIEIFKDVNPEVDYHVVFSMSFMKWWVKQISKLQFNVVIASNSYVEKVEKDWVDITPSASNSYEFNCSIYSCLDVVPINKVCVLDFAQ